MYTKFFLVLLISFITLAACSKKMVADEGSNLAVDANVSTTTSTQAAAPMDPNKPVSNEKTAVGLDCYDKTLAQPSMVCDDDRRPVCGCDGKTYKNACEAGKTGVLHYKWGPCSKTTKTAVQ